MITTPQESDNSRKCQGIYCRTFSLFNSMKWRVHFINIRQHETKLWLCKPEFIKGTSTNKQPIGCDALRWQHTNWEGEIWGFSRECLRGGKLFGGRMSGRDCPWESVRRECQENIRGMSGAPYRITSLSVYSSYDLHHPG